MLMKSKITLYLCLMSLTSAFIYYSLANNSKDQVKNSKSEEAETWVGRRAREIQRLRDPNTGEIPKNIKELENQFVNSLPGSFANIYQNKYSKVQSTASWTQRGPYYVGGRTYGLVLDIKNENRILAGAVDGGMWLSENGGTNWKKTTKANQNHSVSCLTQDIRPGKENIWYYGTGEIFVGPSRIGNGIFKSTDNGNSWEHLTTTIAGSPSSWDNIYDYVYSIVTNPKAASNKDEVLAAIAQGGVIRSTDGGTTWKFVLGSFANGNGYFTDVKVGNNGVFYATISQYGTTSANAKKGIFRSVDGEKWTDITPKDFPALYNRIAIGICPSDENQVYFVAETPKSGLRTFNQSGDTLWHSFYKYTYISGDGTGAGATWENRSQNLPMDPDPKHQMNSQGGYNLLIGVHPQNPNIVYLGAVDLYRSTDGFSSPAFTVVGGTCPDNTCPYDYRYINHHSDIHAIKFLPSNPSVMFTGSDGGIHKTLDNQASHVDWISLNNGYFSTQFYSAAIDKQTAGSEIILGGLQDNGTLFTNTNNTKHPWTEILRADGFACQVANGGSFVVTSQNSTYQPKIKIWKEEIGANGEVTKRRRIDPIGGTGFIWNTPFVIDPHNNDYLYVAGGPLVWRQSKLTQIQMDEGKDSISFGWDSLSFTRLTDKNGTQAEAVSAISVSTEPANVLYYGTTLGKVFRIDNANSGNPKPFNITANIFPKQADVSSIAIDPNNAMNILVSFSNYNVKSMFISKDGGSNFIELPSNLEGANAPAIMGVEIMKLDNKVVYFAATTAGLFSTSNLFDKFTVWVQEGASEIGNTYIGQVSARHNDHFVAVGSYGSGMFHTYYNEVPSLPTAPSLVSPLQNTKSVNDTITLKWNGNSEYYYNIQISKDANFTDLVKDVYGIQDLQYYMGSLDAGHKEYYWRVRSQNSSGFSEFSETRKFVTIIAPPTMIYPSASQENLPLEFEIKWEDLPYANTYHLQVSSNFGFTALIINDSTLTTNTFNISNLELNKRYYVRVRAKEGSDISTYSKSQSFKTIVSNGVFSEFEDNSFSIFPNPAINKITVHSLYQYIGKSTIRIFDNSGLMLFSWQYENWQNSTDIPLDNLASGSYYLEFINSDKRVIKKFLKK